MNEIGRLLREGDPIAREPGLGAADIDRMRHEVMNAALEASPRPWRGPLVVAAAGMVLIAGIAAAQFAILLQPRPGPPPDRRASSVAGPHGAIEVRQLQFVTRGGTRVIWTFDSTFDIGTPR